MNKRKLYLLNSLIILLFCSCISKKRQIVSRSHLNQIIADYYYDNKEITLNQKEMIIKEFSELVSIENLQDNTKFKGANGMYSISLNITHTTGSLLVLCNNKNYIYMIKPNMITKLRRNDCDGTIEISNENNLTMKLKKIEEDNAIIKSKNLLPSIQ
ncbi:hypothetical protein BBI01_09160 [Chryseobacterium artocarpi]|uniref:Lipoprotein n=1 Tax=Chryseobacterium artocarpi TaxID=1414727 RepID=A0A1B8ZL23_9FLAO|nr:hypothetical protein [Chryseobacterium artocarpi]OCA72295.1 hypothetical protein BBI01_09160 [Chryseobacterium artocarpi]